MDPLDIMKRQYLQVLEPEQLLLPSPNRIRLRRVQAELYEAMFTKASLTRPPPNSYKLRVLKKLVKAMEEAIVDPEEDVGSLQRPLTCLFHGVMFETLLHFSLSC